MSWLRPGPKHKCIDCKHCDIENLKCYPESKDCHSEYDLTKEDLETANICDFFKNKDCQT